jgi:hypothetical protein
VGHVVVIGLWCCAEIWNVVQWLHFNGKPPRMVVAVFGSRLFILFFSKYGSSCLNLKVARDNLVKKEI